MKIKEKKIKIYFNAKYFRQANRRKTNCDFSEKPFNQRRRRKPSKSIAQKTKGVNSLKLFLSH